MSAPPATYNRMITHRVLRLLGLSISGDLGPWTTYTNKNGKVIAYPRAPPEKPATAAQVRQRNRLSVAMENWRNEPQPTKDAWTLLAAKLSLCATGHNLYISLSLVPDSDELATAVARTGVAVVAPAYVPP